MGNMTEFDGQYDKGRVHSQSPDVVIATDLL